MAGRDEAVDDSASVSGSGPTETVRGGDQPPRLTQRWRLGVGTQIVTESGVLGQQSRGADGQGGLEQRQRGELRRGDEQAMVEVRWGGVGGRHRVSACAGVIRQPSSA